MSSVAVTATVVVVGFSFSLPLRFFLASVGALFHSEFHTNYTYILLHGNGFWP